MSYAHWLNRCSLVATAVVASLAVAICLSATSHADTVAYWRFEEGPAGTDVIHIAGEPNTFSPDVLDESGNGNHLSAWVTGGGPGHGYRVDRPVTAIGLTGAANNFSVQNTGGFPGMFTETGSQVSTMTFPEFTIEVSFMPETGGFRTLVGRDSQGSVTTGNLDLAALYFQIQPDSSLAIKFSDVSGYWHEAISPVDTIAGFAFPDTAAGTWYHAAAVSDGATLSLYLANADTNSGYQLVAQTDMTASGSPDTTLTAGTGDGGDWDAGNWTVGRGLYAGGHGDRAYGFIDEVRISDSALAVTDLLHQPPALGLVVNTSTGNGNVQLVNNSTRGFAFDYYEITSAAGALAPGGWDSLEDQGIGLSLVGDFNGDTVVDAGDYTVWRDSVGDTGAGLAADANGDQVVDAADYALWRANFGGQGGGGGFGFVEAGGSSASILSESSLDGYTLGAGQSLDLGSAFNPSVLGNGVDGDLVLRFASPNGGFFDANVSVTYVTDSALAAAAAVPEPSALVVVTLGCMVCGLRRMLRSDNNT
jgi:hypothetical protein